MAMGPDSSESGARQGARYVAELDKNPAVDELFAKIRPYTVVILLFGARDPRLNQAVVLADYLRGASARIS